MIKDDIINNYFLQATVCLCDRDTCNGPSLPPREMIEDDHDIIDIEEVVREMNAEPKEVLPEPVSSSGRRRTLKPHLSFVPMLTVVIWEFCWRGREGLVRGGV